jgi:3-dehydroquinate synthase
MKKLLVRGASNSSQILVGESIDNLKSYVQARRTVIITDSTVEKLYREQFPAYPIISIGVGEKIKTLETVTTSFQPTG